MYRMCMCVFETQIIQIKLQLFKITSVIQQECRNIHRDNFVYLVRALSPVGGNERQPNIAG